MSQSSTNASSTNANTPSTPQSQTIPLSGFANFANQPNPILPNQIPQFTPQQQQQILQNYYLHPQVVPPYSNDPISQFFIQQQLLQQQFQSQQTQPPQQQHEIVEETQEAVPEPQQAGTSHSKKKKICKKVQWSADEEELLAKAWIHVSEDSEIANNQADRQFWKRIMSAYNEQAVSLGLAERNKDQLNSKFTAMSAQVKAFVGHYAEAERLRTSGSDDASVKEAAHQMYKNAEVGTFKYEKAWLVLKDKSRWRNYAKIETPMTTVNLDDVDIPDDIFADDPTPRPQGKSRGSKRKESSSASENAQSSSSAFCATIVEQFKKLTKTKSSVAKAKKEMIKAQQQAAHANEQAANAKEQAAYATTRKEDMTFLQTPTQGMTEKEAEWIENEKVRIRVKYGMV